MYNWKHINRYNYSVTVLPIGKQKNYLFLAVVKHSQSLLLAPLKVWLTFRGDGEVLCAHCTCIAGFGEASAITKHQFSSTSLPCSWLPPTFRSVEFAEVHKTDFTTPQQKRKSSDHVYDDKSKKHKVEIPPPTEDNIKIYYLKLSKLKVKPVLLSLISGLNDSYVPKYFSGILPKPLTYLYNKET